MHCYEHEFGETLFVEDRRVSDWKTSDLQLLKESLKFVRKLPETEPFKAVVGTYEVDCIRGMHCLNTSTVKEAMPGPECNTDEDLLEYIKNHTGTSFRTFLSSGDPDSELKSASIAI